MAKEWHTSLPIWQFIPTAAAGVMAPFFVSVNNIMVLEYIILLRCHLSRRGTQSSCFVIYENDLVAGYRECSLDASSYGLCWMPFDPTPDLASWN